MFNVATLSGTELMDFYRNDEDHRLRGDNRIRFLPETILPYVYNHSKYVNFLSDTPRAIMAWALQDSFHRFLRKNNARL